MTTEEVCRIKILSFDSERVPSSFIQGYEIPFQKENTILDSLYYKHVDPILAFRGSCFAGGWCNVCAVRVNGRSLLACKHFAGKGDDN
jgi:succinate dehydrogenase/fumarate reductase-like Fe-S protein